MIMSTLYSRALENHRRRRDQVQLISKQMRNELLLWRKHAQTSELSKNVCMSSFARKNLQKRRAKAVAES
jgi:hypothetical protein